jgi:Putative prokaryotic signal transducing protein
VRWPWSRSRPEPRRVRAEKQPCTPEQPGASALTGVSDRAGAAERSHLRLVKVGYARNLPEAEMLQGLLRQEGIESMVRRNAGADVPDFLAAGGRDVLVAEPDAQRARELLS